MLLQTPVEIKKAPFEIDPTDRILFVGSCFADNIGRRFADNMFRSTVNPFGVMYNPASILHTVEKMSEPYDVVVFTLGTNHVYILNETGEIVDNCQKRPQKLFTERELTVDECADYLNNAIALLRQQNAKVKVILTVSPIRYQKYGFHESQLSKATLLLAVNKVTCSSSIVSHNSSLISNNSSLITNNSSLISNNSSLITNNFDTVNYFPAYEIMNDELRDYRFYQPDMIHPSEQAVDYIYQRFTETYFSRQAFAFQNEWQPIRRALTHRPFNPDSEEYLSFRKKAEQDKSAFIEKWKLSD